MGWGVGGVGAEGLIICARWFDNYRHDHGVKGQAQALNEVNGRGKDMMVKWNDLGFSFCVCVCGGGSFLALYCRIFEKFAGLFKKIHFQGGFLQ